MMRNIIPDEPHLIKTLPLNRREITDLSLIIGIIENPIKMPGFSMKTFPIILDCGKNVVSIINLEF